jgi:DNA-3-methyladenine glycosylase II
MPRSIMVLMSVPSATVAFGDRAEQAMAEHVAEFEVLGPWSLETSRRFWEGFTPAALAGQPAGPGLRTVFCAEGDWRRAGVEATQAGATARLMVSGDGDLEAATAQACRFLALDVDARGWPEVGRRDPVIGDAQAQLPGLRPCGFHSHRAGRPAARRADRPPRRGWRIPATGHPGPGRPGSSRP